MTNPVRIFIARLFDGSITAINVDDQTRVVVGVDSCDHHTFFTDCIGLDRSLISRYDAGYAIACGMTKRDWVEWVSCYGIEADSADHVWLTIATDPDLQGSISALDLVTKREVLVLSDHTAFKRDVSVWNESAYQQSLSFVAHISANDWALWLEQWEALATVEAA